MLKAPQVMMTEEQWENILAADSGKPRMSLKAIMMPPPDERRRSFIPSPTCTSTDTFRFNTGLTPIPPKEHPDIPTNGAAWNHDAVA